jgi:glycosyltransferase involved in cell wall biosynthesis
VKVAYVLHGYPPVHNAGAEYMAHRMLLRLARRHEVRVWSRSGAVDCDGIAVSALRTVEDVREGVEWADVVFTHLNETKLVEQVCQTYRRPLVHVIHNHRSLRVYGVHWASLLVFNSYWLHAKVRELSRVPRTVYWPPVPVGGTNGGPGGVVGLVNAQEAKGVRTFYGIAKALPARRFEAVRGAYGVQQQARPINATLLPNTAGLEWWWPHVGVYCQPSTYESFGMAAVEAMAHGIPVIASPTPGLKESVGDAGVFHEPSDVAAWVSSVDKLGQPDVWSLFSVAASDRAVWLAARSADQHDDLELLLERL